MENKVILLDTSVLINFFRKSKKENSFLNRLVVSNSTFQISVITHFEILRGITPDQQKFWWSLLKNIEVISYTPAMNYTATAIINNLKSKRKSISVQDLMIAATAVHFNFPLATLNQKHFEDIDELQLIIDN